MSPPTPFSIAVHANGAFSPESSINTWELKASRRALLNLKTLLYAQTMLDLLTSKIEAADKYYKEVIAASNGQFRECRTDLKVTGISAGEALQAHLRWLKSDRKELALGRMLPAHPEHYAMPEYEGAEGLVEVIGEHMARLRFNSTDPIPDFVLEYGDPTYPMKNLTIGELEDGTVLFYILHEFRDSEEGV
ncbi:hypothetical protein K402DRAFT_391698 [Aulographum hederae CBS 113979]|uniref:Uncharacterized protein n=1 Tax=Aulographum hederae CBS 113979 TaxID=1176131 RepID=A0A6G1H5G7_9PEZI|nr:hypothetical protein K402DRAFT_391698 [Aulographum hederae CBS 113979]